MIKRMMAEREGEIAHVQDTKCKNDVLAREERRKMNTRESESEIRGGKRCVYVRILVCA